VLGLEARIRIAGVVQGDSANLLEGQDPLIGGLEHKIALAFLDPPFNQGKEYVFADDDLPEGQYWAWMTRICCLVRDSTLEGGAIYLMHREKNAEYVLSCLRESGWRLQNLIIWTKKTSAVPNIARYGKQYQIIAFATNGRRPRVFNKLRIDPPLPPEYKNPRTHGLFVTDVWDDIREMTSGYYAGDEALRSANGEREHKQQSPVALLLRILLSSTMPGDLVLDPFAGTGTTLVVADQLGRSSMGIEIDPKNARLIRERLDAHRESDSVAPLRSYYRHTRDLGDIWPEKRVELRATGQA
jgi:site-specific DNA-methyltransferase (adenine-specific)